MLEVTTFDINLYRVSNSDKGEIVCKSEEGHINMCNSTIPKGQGVVAEYFNKMCRLKTCSTSTVKRRHCVLHENSNLSIYCESASLCRRVYPLDLSILVNGGNAIN